MKFLSCGGVLLASALLCAQSSWAQAAKFTIQRFEVSGNTLLAAESVHAAVAPFAGEGRDMADIGKAAEALRSAYAKAGYPVVQVFPPEQTASGGIITLRVIEARLGKISVAGNAAYDEANIRASLPPLKEGVSPNASQVVAAIVLANENPAKQVAVNFRAGLTADLVDARIDVTEERIEKYTASYDNSGSVAAGYNRISLAYQHANLGNQDHMLNLALSTTIENPDKGLSFVAAYRIPFYQHGVSLDLIGSYSDSNTTMTLPGNNGTLNFTGRGTYLGTRLNQALSSIGEYRHKLVYGLDYKDFANETVTNGGARSNQGTVTSTPLSVAYIAQAATPAYQAGGSITYLANMGFGLHSSDRHYNDDTTGAPVHWNAWRASASLGVPLPADWQLRAAVNAQFTDYRLVNAERFGIGGASSVRGYAERSVAGDSGYTANLELYTPDFGKHLMDSIQARGVLFVDHGQVRQTINQQTGPGLPPIALLSIGFGLRLVYAKDLTVKADVGFSQTPAANQNGNPITTMLARQTFGLKTDTDRWGLHVSANYTF